MKNLGLVGVVLLGVGAILLTFGNGFGIIGLLLGGVMVTDPSYQK